MEATLLTDEKLCEVGMVNACSPGECSPVEECSPGCSPGNCGPNCNP